LEIRINDQPLQFTLEHETTLGEVMHAVQDWLKASDLILTSVRNGSEELLGGYCRDWEAMPLAQVRTLSLTARRSRELGLANLRTVLEYIAMLSQALESQDERQLAGLSSGLPPMVESLRKHFSGELEDQARMVADGLQEWETTPAALSPEKRRKLIELLSSMEARATQRLRELSEPREALRAFLSELDLCIAGSGRVSVLLQTGKDRQAMESIIRFSELSQSLISIFTTLRREAPHEARNLSIGGKNLEEFYTELNGVLRQLLEAFQGQDSVLIGDLMEYEIAPRLESLRGFIREFS